MSNRERKYIIALTVLGFLNLFVVGETFVLMRYWVQGGALSRLGLELIASITALNLLVILLILIIFFAWRTRGRLFLTALNIVMLFNIPFGTILGIYYLWKIAGQSDGMAEKSDRVPR
jgi:hypothetical protein